MENKIVIESIPQSEQRYPTIGDYWRDPDGTLHIKVSKLRDVRHEYLVAIHELIEVLLTEHKGIKEPDIMAFDIMYEKEREEGKHTADEEPGWDKRAPYMREHAFAESIERLVALEIGVHWYDYNKDIEENT